MINPLSIKHLHHAKKLLQIMVSLRKRHTILTTKEQTVNNNEKEILYGSTPHTTMKLRQKSEKHFLT